MEQISELPITANDVRQSTSAEKAEVSLLSVKFKPISSHLLRATVEVSAKIGSVLRAHTMKLYQKRTQSPGIAEVSLEYIKKNYRNEVNSDLEKLVYRYFVIDYLMSELIGRKIRLVNDPRLGLVTTNDDVFVFTFDLSTADVINLREWKNFAFKPPRRKNYKDLDKQVESFIKTHQEQARKSSTISVEKNDWVCFNTQLVDSDNKPLIAGYQNTYWLKATADTLQHPLVESLIGKEVGDTLFSDQFSLTQDFTHHMHDGQKYALTITTLAKGAHLAIDSIKQMFKLPNKIAVHEKIIEVFSYRNDLSQRRSTIEEMFHLFFSKHRFEVPKHLALRKQEELLIGLKRRPDYYAYRKDKNFMKHLAALAEQQLKEEILFDQIAAHEKIKIED